LLSQGAALTFEVGGTLLSKMEQRYDAVLAVIRDGSAISEAATKLGVNSESLYRWMARYEAAKWRRRPGAPMRTGIRR
jgi:transposase-like protein